MNYRIILVYLLAAILFASCNNGKAKIVGVIEGVTDTRIILSADDAMNKTDTIEVKNGKFTYDIELKEPTPMMLILESTGERAILFAENKNMNIAAKAGEFDLLKVTGSPSHALLDEYSKSISDLQQKGNALRKKAETANDPESIQQIQLEAAQIDSIENLRILDFIKKHPSSHVSAFMASSRVAMEGDFNKVMSYFNLLDKNALGTMYGQKVVNKVNKMKSINEGSVAPDFTVYTPDGKPISLNQYKGKFVLVDFWASWCKPCRVENPNVVKAYMAYKDKGFDVFGVSLDEDKNAWIEAIQKDQLSWQHGSDLQGWSSKAATLYEIQSIPSNILLDKDGKIIGKNLRGEQLLNKLSEVIK